MKVNICDDEQINDLQNGGHFIIQKKRGFRFGTDAVLLSDFALIKKRAKVADFGTGTGIIALLTAIHHPDAAISAIEIQSEMAKMARRSVLLNDLEGRIKVINGDIISAPKLLGSCVFDQVICNPPYNEPTRSLVPDSENRLISRIESAISISDICLSASKVLKSGGRLSVIFPSRRLNEMFDAMQGANLAPKRVRSIYTRTDLPPKLTLIDAVKQGGSQLFWLPPLILTNPDGSHTEEWHRIYD